MDHRRTISWLAGTAVGLCIMYTLVDLICWAIEHVRIV